MPNPQVAVTILFIGHFFKYMALSMSEMFEPVENFCESLFEPKLTMPARKQDLRYPGE